MRDTMLKELAELRQLQTLMLDLTQVTDSGLKELVGFKDLPFLDLGNTKITDAGLKELARLKNLKKLSLIQTRTTDAGVLELRKALPNLRIFPRDEDSFPGYFSEPFRSGRTGRQ